MHVKSFILYTIFILALMCYARDYLVAISGSNYGQLIFSYLLLTLSIVHGRRSSKVLADSISMQDHVEQLSGSMDDYRGCDSLAISKIFWERDAIEPKTGIKFPTVLDSSFGGEDSSHLTTEVFSFLVSTTLCIMAIYFCLIVIQFIFVCKISRK